MLWFGKFQNWLFAVFDHIHANFFVHYRYNVFAGYAWYHMPIQVTNKAIAWASITGFALAQLPGVLAHLWNTVVYDSLYTKPSWLQSSLANRKQVGLLSLWLLTVHVIMSIILFNPAYYGKLFADPEASSSQMNSVGEVSLFFAILAVSLYFVRGICMLPSAGIQMTSKQLRLINGSMAWVGLAFATIHVMVLGVKSWNDQLDWPGGLPPITLLSVAFPLFVVGLKFIQVGHSSIGRHCLSANYYDDCRSQEMTISFDSDDMGRQSCFNVPDHVVNSSAPPCFSDEQIDFSESQHASSSSKEVRRQIEATEEVCGAVFQTQLSVGHLDATRTTV